MHTHATQKGQIVIPAALRKKYGITAGTRVEVTEGENGRIVLLPITRHFIHGLRGILKGSNALKILEEERRKDREREDRKWKRRRMTKSWIAGA